MNDKLLRKVRAGILEYIEIDYDRDVISYLIHDCKIMYGMSYNALEFIDCRNVALKQLADEGLIVGVSWYPEKATLKNLWKDYIRRSKVLPGVRVLDKFKMTQVSATTFTI